MRGKWSAGIEPRSFTWVFKGVLAISERPGGTTAVHRKVRRDEEFLWLKHQGFTRIISILPSPQPAETYTERGLSMSHYVLRGGPQQGLVLESCFKDLAQSVANGSVTLVHGDEVSDRLLGVLAGYLVWSQRVANAPTAVALIERLFKRTLGPDGRALLNDLPPVT